MKAMTDFKCKTCGTPLDEIPFYPCEEHILYDRRQPDLTSEEEEQALDFKLLAVLHERTGDD